MGVIKKGPFKQSDGVITVPLLGEASFTYHQIGISIFDDLGGEDPEGTLGELVGDYFVVGADRKVTIGDNLKLFLGERSWPPVVGAIDSFTFELVGFNPGWMYEVVISNWG